MYKLYTEIPTFEQCLKIVEECRAFSHSVQEVDGESVHSFKYNLIEPGMWDGFGRMNMRGITFDSHCNLLALAFPKFFNLGENEATINVDLSNPKNIIEKVDGSLISFFKIHGRIESKTMKSVYSDVSNQCREYVKTRPDILQMVERMLEKNLSPIFEYVSAASRIVLDYKETNLYFLGARDMTTGEIIYGTDMVVPSTIKRPQTFGSHSEMTNYLSRTDVEGVVVTLQSGMMLKMKSDTYCRIHKILDNFTNTAIVEHIINNTFDDAIGVLTQHGLVGDVERAKKVLDHYHAVYSHHAMAADHYYQANKHRTRKEIALELMGKTESRFLGSLVFSLIDGKEIRDSINKLLLEKSKTWQLF